MFLVLGFCMHCSSSNQGHHGGRDKQANPISSLPRCGFLHARTRPHWVRSHVSQNIGNRRRGQWTRAHLISIDKHRRGRVGKTHYDVTLSMRAALCFGLALRKRRSARPPCSPQARPAHTRPRATGTRTLPACLLCHHLHCHAALPCSPLGDRA